MEYPWNGQMKLEKKTSLVKTKTSSLTFVSLMTRCFFHIHRQHFRRAHDEDWIIWTNRKIKTARWAIQKYSIFLSDRIMAKQFSWAGHIARMGPEQWVFGSTSWLGHRWKLEVCADRYYTYRKDRRWKIVGAARMPWLFWESRLAIFFDEKR